MMEMGQFYPPIDVCVDAKAVFDAIAASDVCDPADGSLKLHLISVRDRMATGMIRFLYWLDTRCMLADGLTKGGIDRTLLDQIWAIFGVLDLCQAISLDVFEVSNVRLGKC